MRPSRLLAPLIVALAVAAPPAQAASGPCDLIAAPWGSDHARGTHSEPLRTVQTLADRLGPGRTGCLRGGTYSQRRTGSMVARMARGGRPGRRLTLRSHPGERATISGGIFVSRSADYVTLSRLRFDDPTSYRRTREMTVEINAKGTVLDRLDITNRGRKTCVMLGAAGYGRAIDTVIRRSHLHNCGDRGNELFDHAIYVAKATNTRVIGNRIVDTSGYGVHMYPDADRSLVRDNVIVRSGGGLIFAGEGSAVSSHNVVTRNVIAASTRRADITSYWGGRVGRGNVARGNCLGARLDDTTGFRVARNNASLRCGGTVTGLTLQIANALLGRR